MGGVPVFIDRLATQLAQAGDDVMVVTGSATFQMTTKTTTLPSGVTVVRVPAVASPINPGNNRMTYNPFSGVKKAFDDFRPDCVHMHTPAGLLHQAALRQARRRDVPVVITNHVMPENLALNLPAWARGVATRLTRRSTIGFINKTDYLVAPTQTALDLLGPTVSVPKMAITCGVDTAMYHPGKVDPAVLKKYGIDPHKKLLLFLGRLDGEKRIDLLIQAFPGIIRDHPDVQLAIIGKGLLVDELTAQARAVDPDNIIFVGPCSDNDKIRLLHSATLFMMPSPAELQCIAALEALACELPVVAADQAALRELVQPGKNGQMFAYPDTADLARVVGQLLDHPIASATLTKHSREWVLAHHDQLVSVREHQKLFASLTKTR